MFVSNQRLYIINAYMIPGHALRCLRLSVNGVVTGVSTAENFH